MTNLLRLNLEMAGKLFKFSVFSKDGNVKIDSLNTFYLSGLLRMFFLFKYTGFT